MMEQVPSFQMRNPSPSRMSIGTARFANNVALTNSYPLPLTQAPTNSFTPPILSSTGLEATTCTLGPYLATTNSFTPSILSSTGLEATTCTPIRPLSPLPSFSPPLAPTRAAPNRYMAPTIPAGTLTTQATTCLSPLPSFAPPNASMFTSAEAAYAAIRGTTSDMSTTTSAPAVSAAEAYAALTGSIANSQFGITQTFDPLVLPSFATSCPSPIPMVPYAQAKVEEMIIETPQTLLPSFATSCPSPLPIVREKLVEVPYVQTRVEERIIEIPQIQEVERYVPVPIVQIQEVIKQVPKIETREKIIQVPQVQTRIEERIVEVPQIQEVERYVSVPQVQVQEVVRRVPRYQEEIVNVPQLQTQMQERIVEVPVKKTFVARTGPPVPLYEGGYFTDRELRLGPPISLAADGYVNEYNVGGLSSGMMSPMVLSPMPSYQSVPLDMNDCYAGAFTRGGSFGMLPPISPTGSVSMVVPGMAGSIGTAGGVSVATTPMTSFDVPIGTYSFQPVGNYVSSFA